MAIGVALARLGTGAIRLGATKSRVVMVGNYRAPTDLERAFLRVVTLGFPELEKQIECCEVAPYDPTGWCYVRVDCGPPLPIHNPADGPSLSSDDPNHPFIEILLWTNDDGMLKWVEIVDYGPKPTLENAYQLFVDAAKSGRLGYRFKAEDAE